MPESHEGHALLRYDAELGYLRSLVLEMGGLVIDQIGKAASALLEGNIALAQEVIARDHVVNGLDVKADEITVNLIARRAPVAGDLRMVFAISKTVNDLERIGDEAEKIARIAVRLYDNPMTAINPKLLYDIKPMAQLASQILRNSLDAFDRMVLNRAIETAQTDAELDSEFHAAMRRLATFLMEDARNLSAVLDVVIIIKALERIGDHAKNIAEYVVYQIKGKDVRHISPTDLAQYLVREDHA